MALSVTALVTSIGGAQLVTRVGPRGPLVSGLAIAAAGMWLLARVPADASYVRNLVVPLMVAGIGIGLAFVTMSIGALEGVEERDSGLASGLVNASQQIGGALGVALLSTIAVSRSEEVIASHPQLAPAAALAEASATHCSLSRVRSRRSTSRRCADAPWRRAGGCGGRSAGRNGAGERRLGQGVGHWRRVSEQAPSAVTSRPLPGRRRL
jgi:predicted MFS family arabinose efflux permease